MSLTALEAPPGTMMAARYYAPGQVAYESVPVPRPGPGELLVKIHTALTCGTDVKCYRRGHPVLLKSFPSPFGHEGAGIVATIGEGVTAFSVGDRVVCANSAPCYACDYCQKGQHNLCESLDLLNGTYAEYLLVPERIATHNTYRLPDGVPFDVAAFTEPLAVACRGVGLSHIRPGDHVAVLGLGPIGLLMVWLAQWQGATVTAMARSPLKRRLAESFGRAARTVTLDDAPEADTLRQTCTPNGRGFDVVIEAIGLPHTWELAVALTRRGGRVNLFGGCAAGTTVTLDTRRLHYDELTLLSLFHHTPEYVRQAVDLLTSGTLDPRPLITAHEPLSRFEAALQHMESGQAIKIALHP